MNEVEELLHSPSRLDPIDWATYEPYLWQNVATFCHRTATLFGSLTLLNKRPSGVSLVGSGLWCSLCFCPQHASGPGGSCFVHSVAQAVSPANSLPARTQLQIMGPDSCCLE